MDNKPTLLVVDDTEENVMILVELLKDYDVVEAYDGETALTIVQEEKVELILLDIMMPEMDGYEVCRRLKENPKSRDIPVIFITAKTDEDSIDKAYRDGGVDYITKPFKPRELLARVRTQIQFRELIQKLDFLASRDSMTNIYNRRKFFELSEQLFGRTQDNNIFAIMIDIDKFKDINDSYGHSVGDEVIKATTRFIDKQVRQSTINDFVFGRLGGEEFAVICTSESIAIVEQICEQVRLGIEQLNITIEQYTINYTISSGVARKIDNEDLDSLLKRADDGLYEAKSSGRNRVVVKT